MIPIVFFFRNGAIRGRTFVYLKSTNWLYSFPIDIDHTPSVFCYDEHKKKNDIHFAMNEHTWRMSPLLRRLFWIPPCCVFENGYSITKTGQFWKSIHIRIEFYLFVSHGGMKDRGSTCKFRKALRALRNLHMDLLSFIHHEKQTRRIQSLNEALVNIYYIYPFCRWLYFMYLK